MNSPFIYSAFQSRILALVDDAEPLTLASYVPMRPLEARDLLEDLRQIGGPIASARADVLSRVLREYRDAG